MIGIDAWPLVDAARMRALDRHTIEGLGVPGEVLMESAGRDVVAALLEEFGDALGAGAEVCVLCGQGNNAGDGYVVARHLALLGRPVRVLTVGDPARSSPDARANRARAEAAGVSIEDGSADLPERGVLVDALFGTGLSRPVEGAARAVIEAANASGLPIVAIDLPSGLDTDTGQVLGVAVRAALTVTISLPKPALALEPGRSCAGRVRVARIGIADRLPDDADTEPSVVVWTRACAGRALPERPAHGHKGSFGHVLVVAGSEGKTGAAALAARAAGRAGAGLVTVACPRGLNDVLEAKCTEAMTVPVSETLGRSLGKAALPEIEALAASRDVLAIGPGIGTDPETVALMRDLVVRIERPLVIDADGLNALAGDVGCLRGHPGAPGSCVLTPHPGEAARLLGSDAASVNRDRIGAARSLARESGAVVLLKGAGSISAHPDGRAIVNPTGGPALATGGTGDVLTGIVAALLAQGLAPLTAAAAGAYLHGAAGDTLASQNGDSGLLAEDLAEALPGVTAWLRRASSQQEGRGDGVEGVTGRSHASLLPFP